MIELYKADEEKKQVRMRDMEDGQVAVILKNTILPDYTGRIVQRVEDGAIVFGMPEGAGWTDHRNNALPLRLLEDGEILVFRAQD